MPRSDKLYIMITVGLASILVIISIVTTILTLTGDSKERPAYESAPPKALAKPNPTSGSMVDAENAQRPPIDDQTYLILHKQTRLITRSLATGEGWRERVWANGITREALIQLDRQRKGLEKDLVGAKVRPRVSVTVYRPTPPSDPKKKAVQTSKTVGSVGMLSRNNSKLGSLRAEIYWQRVGNLWQIDDVILQLDVSEASSDQPSNPSEEGSIESPSSSEESAAPDTPSGSLEIPDTPSSETEMP